MAERDDNIVTAHMVLGRDLNHHDTLFAGQASAYMIECAFLAVQSFLQSPHIVCRGLDGLRFFRPVHKGDTVGLSSRIVYAGETSAGAYICMNRRSDGQQAASCFVSFVHIDEETGRAVRHHAELPELDEEGCRLRALYLSYKELSRS